MKYENWTLIDWDGNIDRGFKCWRKSFGRGHVSIGAGGFLTIAFSYGPNGNDSCSSSRWRKNGQYQTEEEAMKMVDENNGKYRFKN